jgi:hypothetical protein
MNKAFSLLVLVGLAGCQSQPKLKPVAAETVTATYSHVLYSVPSPTPTKKPSVALKPSPTPKTTAKPKATPVAQAKKFIESTETTTVISSQPVVAPDTEIKPSN